MTKRKKKVYRSSNEPYEGQSFVVFKVKLGRTEPGVYMRRVTVDGRIAFVHPRDGAAAAQIIPTSHVFKKKDQANAFFADGGELKWIAYRNEEGVPEVVQAKVRSYIVRRHQGWNSQVQIISRVDGVVVEGRQSCFGYRTEREAYRHFFTNMAKYLKEVNEELEKHQARKDGLLKIARKIKSLGITRGLKED